MSVKLDTSQIISLINSFFARMAFDDDESHDSTGAAAPFCLLCGQYMVLSYSCFEYDEWKCPSPCETIRTKPMVGPPSVVSLPSDVVKRIRELKYEQTNM